MSNYGTNTTEGEIYREENVIAESFSNPVKAIKTTILGTPAYAQYESAVVTPGSLADGYDVKNVGGRFATVTTSYKTIIKNNDPALSITVYLNTDNINPIVIGADSELDVPGLAVTNIFIDTENTYASTVGVTLFG